MRPLLHYLYRRARKRVRWCLRRYFGWHVHSRRDTSLRVRLAPSPEIKQLVADELKAEHAMTSFAELAAKIQEMAPAPRKILQCNSNCPQCDHWMARHEKRGETWNCECFKCDYKWSEPVRYRDEPRQRAAR